MKHKNKKYIILSIKIIIVFLSFGFVGLKLMRNSSISDVYVFLANLSFISYSILAMVVFGVFLNWLIESIKWKKLVSVIQDISLDKSYKAILAGITISMFTPNRTGEFAGRVMVLDNDKRIDGVISTIIGSFSQLIVTIILGLLAVFLFQIGFNDPLPEIIISWSVVLIIFSIICIFSVIIFFNLRKLTELLWDSKYFLNIKKYLEFIKKYSKADLFIILVFSFLRYSVFVLQFFLLFKVFNINISLYECFIGVGIMYFIMAVIPTFTIAELGIRGTVSILVFEMFTSNIFGIVSASLLLWIFNLAIPALIGSIVFYKMKI